MTSDLGCFNLDDLRTMARSRLPRGVWEYLERGVEDETAIARNRAAFDALTFRPRVLRNVEQIDLSIPVLGRQSPLPFAIAPTGAAGLMRYKGDIALARAAAKAGIAFTISSASTMNLEEIAAIGGRMWFQLYFWKDRALSLAVVDRAHQVGCEALLVTLDLPVPPNREYLHRSGYGMPLTVNRRNAFDLLGHPRWLFGVIARYLVQDGRLPTQANLPSHLQHSLMQGGKPGTHFKQDNLDWDDVARLREQWPGKFILKGILHPDDARRAAQIGADAIVVSNHGARSLDHAIAPITALPDIVTAVGGRLEIILDSGIRRGSDIVKAMALGADATMVGRATLYGMAAAGEAGADRAITLLAEETRRTLAYLGHTAMRTIDKDVLYLARDQQSG